VADARNRDKVFERKATGFDCQGMKIANLDGTWFTKNDLEERLQETQSSCFLFRWRSRMGEFI
jgi:hypothetical protein